VREPETFGTKQLLAAGWRRQNVASEPRLSEAVELYRSLGHDVLLVPVLQECAAEGSAESCTACFGAEEDGERYQVIYTRPRRAEESES
jgi:hypothetical protein